MLGERDTLYISPQGADFDWNIIVNQYEVIRKIGQGGFGSVYLAEHKKTKLNVAIKYMDISSFLHHADLVESIFKEAAILMKLEHSNIIKLFHAFIHRKILTLIMEYSQGGQLLDYVKQKGKIPQPEAQSIMLQIFRAVNYCHRKGVIHRDLKLENILFWDKARTRIKVVDFGIAGVCRAQEKDKSDAGTIKYMSPELISGKTESNPKIDVWALGIIIYALLFGKLPFNGSSNSEVIKSITKSSVRFPKSIPVSEEAKNLILRMLQKDPARRIKMLQIQLHPWFALDQEDMEASKPEKGRLLSFDFEGMKIESIKDSMTPVAKEEKKTIQQDQNIYDSTPPAAVLGSGDKRSFGKLVQEYRFKDRKKPPLPPAAGGRNPRSLKQITREFESERFLPFKPKILTKNYSKNPHSRSQSNIAKQKLRMSYDGHLGMGHGKASVELLSLGDENGKKKGRTPQSEAL